MPRLRPAPRHRHRRLVAAAMVLAAILAVGFHSIHQGSSTTRAAISTRIGGVAVAGPIHPSDAPGTTSTAATNGQMKLLQEHTTYVDRTAQYGPGPQLTLDAGILLDVDTHAVLWARNPHLPHAPASTAKVMTTMVTLENRSPDELLTITPEALQEDPDETVMGLKAGEQLTVRELMSGMLTVSGNDGANALAADTVGLPTFVATMNAQLAALGLHDSHFTSPVGLDDPDQKASAYDLAAIAAADYRHFDLFREIVGSRDIELPASPLHHDYSLHNLNELLTRYPSAVGIKPGYTAAAGRCLIGMAVRNGHRLLSVVLGARPDAFNESHSLLDWGFVQEGLPSQLPPPKPSPTPHPPLPPRATGIRPLP